MLDDRRPPRVSEAKVSYHAKQLLKMFARADDASFLKMVWAIDALQSGREAVAQPHLSAYPPEAAVDSSIRSPLGMHRWELETLIVQLLLVPKELQRAQGNLVLDCSRFDAARQTINRLRSLENVESARYLTGDFTIWGEMHRIAQRQFHWQRGYFNTPQVYRYAYLYARGKCAEYFKQAYGFDISDLIFTGFGLFSAYLNSPSVPRVTSVPEVGLTDDIVQRALPMMSCSREQARIATADLVTRAQDERGGPIPTALLPSILRKTPLIYVDDPNQLIAPIPETIILRVTAGLYNDLIAGGQDVINDANGRFEQYCIDLISMTMKQFEVVSAHQYGPKATRFETPDIIIKHQSRIAAVAECKATKLTYAAQFAEDPFTVAKKQYAQLAKGIFQIWRFFSHVRRGVIEAEISEDCHAIVFTLDAFMQMARDPRNKVLAEANALADADGNIEPDDRKEVIVCPIYDLEFILTRATEETFLASLKAAISDKYEGWMLREVHRDTGAAKDFGEPRPYPFDLVDVLPWWGRLDVFDHIEA